MFCYIFIYFPMFLFVAALAIISPVRNSEAPDRAAQMKISSKDHGEGPSWRRFENEKPKKSTAKKTWPNP